MRMFYLRLKMMFSILPSQEAEELMLLRRPILVSRSKKKAHRFHTRKCKKELKESITKGLPLFLYIYDDTSYYVKPEDLKTMFEKEFPGYYFQVDGYGLLVSCSKNY